MNGEVTYNRRDVGHLNCLGVVLERTTALLQIHATSTLTIHGERSSEGPIGNRPLAVVTSTFSRQFKRNLFTFDCADAVYPSS